MASQAQTLANQSNARHSTGPKTEAGKSRSSVNSFRHGLTAAIVVLPSEDMAAYQEHCRAMLAEFEPVGAWEGQLAQTIIDAQWRLHRVSVLETNLLSLAQFEPAPDHLALVADPQAKAALLEANALIVHERQLRNLHLQEQRLRRVAQKTLDQLTNLQINRVAQERAEQSVAKPAIGFDFANAESTAPPTSQPNVPSAEKMLTPPQLFTEPAKIRHAQSTS